MRNIIEQFAVLPANAQQLFEMYLDCSDHAAFTGHSVTISAQPGSKFHAFGGQLSGTMLAVVRPKLIVQSWRSVVFKPDDPDSTLILMFSPEPNDDTGNPQGRIDLVHLDVPDHDYQGVTEGWPKFYWTPWRNYLQQKNDH